MVIIPVRSRNYVLGTIVAKPFDLLTEFAKFGLEQKLSLNDPTAKSAFVSHVTNAVEDALRDPVLLHGQRTQAMFEGLLVSLGEFKLLKEEDAGRVFPAEQFKVPDFRVALNSGEQWLIEVKNVYQKDPLDQRRRLMTREYLQKLAEYSRSTGANLKIAIFWARWSVWTLVAPESFVDANGDIVLDMPSAMKQNELSELGDRTIGTKPPLRLRLTMDAARTSAIGPDGTVSITIGGVELYCDETKIIDPTEQQIAWMLIQYGEWLGNDPEAIIEGDQLIAIEFRWEPVEQVNRGFEFIGSLSTMFSRYFAEQTVKDRQVVQLRAPLQPSWFAPLISRNYVGHALPLWNIRQTLSAVSADG